MEFTEEQLRELFERALDSLQADDLFDLCRQVSEQHLPPDHELYKYFHDKSNLEDSTNDSSRQNNS